MIKEIFEETSARPCQFEEEDGIRKGHIYEVKDKHFDWLISTVEEQQKEIDELNRINSVMDDNLVKNGREIMKKEDERAELEYQNKRLREALSFYANRDNYYTDAMDKDNEGEKARQALGVGSND